MKKQAGKETDLYLSVAERPRLPPMRWGSSQPIRPVDVLILVVALGCVFSIQTAILFVGMVS